MGAGDRSSLPWTAFLAATGGVLVAGLLVAYFGLERANHLRLGEEAAARRSYQVAPPGSFLMLVASNFPTRLDAATPTIPASPTTPAC